MSPINIDSNEMLQDQKPYILTYNENGEAFFTEQPCNKENMVPPQNQLSLLQSNQPNSIVQSNPVTLIQSNQQVSALPANQQHIQYNR